MGFVLDEIEEDVAAEKKDKIFTVQGLFKDEKESTVEQVSNDFPKRVKIPKNESIQGAGIKKRRISSPGIFHNPVFILSQVSKQDKDSVLDILS